ncbi:hypothetical protein OFK47_18410 [Acinetobacter baumannii]|uniref:hypothetical protein n=1 Tax=Acinetobacter baumannii TaxID=470 RepID=UPI001F5EC5B7|nr:hypothetical protein [Acinetobacter baumannii]MCX3003242.1 hypothetical protein [Acinetobacter baumannii]MDA4958378.1 hypothetical protein [Acinetobacter baumannii]MDA5030924.1 hypothetical protein [Acinetobacter baumannii]MDA5038194.1 hypothetical protein [Acinetobacter baumannii]
MDKAREEFEKKLKCQDLLSELTFCEKTSSYEGDILPTNLATINGAYWAWVKRQAEMDEQQAKVEELEKQLSEYIFVAETIDEMYVKEVQKSDELQKRVDKAIRFLVEAELYQSEPNIDLAVKALKGEGQ